jgi:hypothetical protein
MITGKTTLSELSAIAATRGIRSIRLRDDTFDPSKKLAEVKTEWRTVTQRGETIAEAIAAAFDALDHE